METENIGEGGVTITLKGSDSVVQSILKESSLTAKELKEAGEIADGNPGAARFLLEIRDEISPDQVGFPCLLSCLKFKNLTGAGFYSHVKELGVEHAVEQFRNAGWC